MLALVACKALIHETDLTILSIPPCHGPFWPLPGIPGPGGQGCSHITDIPFPPQELPSPPRHHYLSPGFRHRLQPCPAGGVETPPAIPELNKVLGRNPSDKTQINMDIDYDKYSEHLDRCNEIEALFWSKLKKNFRCAHREVIGAAFINVTQKVI